MIPKSEYPYLVKLYKNGVLIQKYHYRDVTDIQTDMYGLKSEYTYKVIDIPNQKDITKKVQMV